MDALVAALALIAVVAYVPLSRYAVRRYDRSMHGRRWLPRHVATYATLLAVLFTPGFLVVDLRHGNSFPLPVPAWLALATGSLWGGLLPLCIGWFIARARAAERADPLWLDGEPPRGSG